MKFAFVLAAVLAVSSPAFAQHPHAHDEKGPNGGPMVEVAGFDAELMTDGNTVTINGKRCFQATSLSVGAAG